MSDQEILNEDKGGMTSMEKELPIYMWVVTRDRTRSGRLLRFVRMVIVIVEKNRYG